MEKIKWLLSIIGGVLVILAKKYYMIVIFVMLVVVFDLITGLIKAIVTGERLNRKIAAVGFWKKFALLVALFFGFFLDYFIPYMINNIGIEIPVTALFGMIFGCYIVINECISIAENLYMINPAILPKWVKKLLSAAKDQIDRKGDYNENK